MQTSNNLSTPKLLDAKHYIIAALLIPLGFLKLQYPDFLLLERLLGFGLIGLFLYYFNNPKVLIFLFMQAYFCNLKDWFTYFTLTEGAGARILLVDLLMIMIFASTFLKLVVVKRLTGIYLGGLVVFLTCFWGSNFIQGLLLNPFGFVFGEGRFYISSLLLLAIVNNINKKEDFQKIVYLICLCSINIAIHLIFVIVFEGGGGEPQGISGAGEDDGRFNPGNGEVEIMVFSMLVAFMDFANKKKFHLLKANSLLVIGIFMLLIFITGVRAMTVVGAGILFYFFGLSSKISLSQKLGIIAGFVFLAAVAIQVPSVQKVLRTQSKYIEIIQGGGSKHDDTTANWRLQMWTIFLKSIIDDPQRVFIGRPFDNEQVNVVEMNWRWYDGSLVRTVDNSLAHNDFVSITMTNGFVFTGLLLFLLIAYSNKGFRFAKYLRKRGESDLAYFSALLGWYLAIQIFQSATNAEIKHYGFSINLWIFMGLIAALINIYLNNKAQEAPSEAEKVAGSEGNSPSEPVPILSETTA